VVDGVDGGSALITPHATCIGDGTASVLVARALFDTRRRTGARGGEAARGVKPKPGLVERLFTPAIDAAEWSVAAVRSVVGGAIDAATQPQQLAEPAALGAGRRPGRWPPSAEAARSALAAEGRVRGRAKRVAWSRSVRLADVKAIGAPLGAKINDVLWRR